MGDRRGSLYRKVPIAEGLRYEGEAAAVQHALGVVGVVGSGLDTKVLEHGVGLPATEKFDSAGVDPGAEQGGSAAGPEGASG